MSARDTDTRQLKGCAGPWAAAFCTSRPCARERASRACCGRHPRDVQLDKYGFVVCCPSHITCSPGDVPPHRRHAASKWPRPSRGPPVPSRG
eukprot:scaffold77589_cov66-Phaeocystis_antarctica.AAC.4